MNSVSEASLVLAILSEWEAGQPSIEAVMDQSGGIAVMTAKDLLAATRKDDRSETKEFFRLDPKKQAAEARETDLVLAELAYRARLTPLDGQRIMSFLAYCYERYAALMRVPRPCELRNANGDRDYYAKLRSRYTREEVIMMLGLPNELNKSYDAQRAEELEFCFVPLQYRARCREMRDQALELIAAKRQELADQEECKRQQQAEQAKQRPEREQRTAETIQQKVTTRTTSTTVRMDLQTNVTGVEVTVTETVQTEETQRQSQTENLMRQKSPWKLSNWFKHLFK